MLCSRVVRTQLSALSSLGLLICLSCGGEEENTPPPPKLEVRIKDAVTGAPVGSAYVLPSLGGVSQPMQRADASGVWSGEVTVGQHEVRVSAPGYLPQPGPFGAPPSTTVGPGQTGVIEVELDPRSSTEPGSIEGRVTRAGSAVAGVLVVASATVERAGLTDAEGRFVLLDLPLGDYRVEARLAGHVAAPLESVRISAGAPGEANLELSAAAGVTLVGTLRAGASETTVHLVHAATGEPVPGLAGPASPSAGFSLSGVPPGRYRIRGFLEPDAQVLDPDLIRQQEELEFSIAEAAPATVELPAAASIELLAPTGSSTVGTEATFRWAAHPEATFYVVEVRNAEGQLVWGGFDARGTPRFRVLGSSTSIRYGAQGNPTESLAPGRLYRFRVYAGLDVTTGEIFKLIGASEELAGQFRVARD